MHKPKLILNIKVILMLEIMQMQTVCEEICNKMFDKTL